MKRDERSLGEMLTTMFRWKYGYINDENLLAAVEKEPELICALIDYGDLGDVALSAAIESLGYTYDTKYIKKIKKYADPLGHAYVRDAAKEAIEMIEEKNE